MFKRTGTIPEKTNYYMVVLIQSLQKDLASKNPYIGLLRLTRTFSKASPIRKALISRTLSARPELESNPVAQKIISDQELSGLEHQFVLDQGSTKCNYKKIPSSLGKRRHYPRLKALCSSNRRSYDSLVLRKS